jgi:hypothetical protein
MRGIQMPNFILRVAPYFSLWLVGASGLARPSTNLSVMLQNQTERPTRNSRKIKSEVYTNKKYGFRFLLPESWRGYSIVVSEWEGGDGVTYQAGETVPPPEKGPLLYIVHPLWTKSNPRQSIPIMIFTKAQWELIEADKLILSAAPVGPSELGRNAKYVFALPPRFNYADIDGREEVGEIIQSHPLHPF